MVTNKTRKAASVILHAVKVTTLVGTAGALIACPTEVEKIVEVETPTSKYSPGVNMFSDKTAVFATGDEFTIKQWNAIISAIVDKFVTGYSNDAWKESYEEAFDFGGTITIIVEKNPEGYTNYKVSERMLFVGANKVDNLNANAVIVAIGNGDPLVANALPARETPKLNRQVIAFGNQKAKTIAMGGQPRTVYVR